MYRTLTCRAEGRDVAQLQDGLAALGYTVTDPAGVYGSSTAAAASALFEALGYRLPEQRSVGCTEASASGKRAVTAPVIPVADVYFVPRLPAYVTAVHGRVGARVQGTLLSIATGEPFVATQLTLAQSSVVRPGMHVTLSSGQSNSAGIVQSVTPTESGGSAKISPLRMSGSLQVGSAVNVTITVASSGGDVWVAPLTAISTSATGGHYVIVDTHGHRVTVAVRLGVTVAGTSAIYPLGGAKLAVGDQLLINQ
jgi:HlyD family secretion protein